MKRVAMQKTADVPFDNKTADERRATRCAERLVPRVERMSPPAATTRASGRCAGAGQKVVERHAKAVQRPRHQVVLADGEYHIHHLLD